MKKVSPLEASQALLSCSTFPEFGRNVMADQGYWRKLTARKIEVAKKILNSHQADLAVLGLEVDWEPDVPKEAEQHPMYYKLLDNDKVGVYYPKGLHVVNERVGDVQGAKWARNHWEFVLNLEACEKLPSIAEDFGFFVPPEVERAFEHSKKEGLAAVLDSRAHSAELPTWLTSRLKGTTRPFQNAGIVFGMHHKRILLNDEQGLGKSIEALGIIEGAEGYKALLIVPNSMKLHWVAEAQAWLPNRSISVFMTGAKKFVSVYVQGRKVNIPTNNMYTEIVVINYDQVKKYVDQLMCFKWKTILLDESHYIANPKAKRTIAVLNLVNHVNPDYRLALTGTPVANKPHELVTQLEFLDRIGDFGSKSRFLKRWCSFSPTGYGGIKFAEPDKRKLYELNTKLRPFQVRRLKREVLRELPPKVRCTLPVEISNRAEYSWAEKDLVGWLHTYVANNKRFLASISHLSQDEQIVSIRERQRSTAERAERGKILREIQALRYIAVKGKVPAIKTWIEDFLKSGEKLVVYCIHRDIQDDLFEAFPNAARIYGGDSLIVRKQNERRFQEDPECKLIICSIPAASEGITLHAASNLLVLEMPWTALKCNQTEDRIHRIGQHGSCVVYYILAQDTIDERIAALIDGKREMMTAITDGEVDADLEEMGIMDSLISKLTE